MIETLNELIIINLILNIIYIIFVWYIWKELIDNLFKLKKW